MVKSDGTKKFTDPVLVDTRATRRADPAVTATDNGALISWVIPDTDGTYNYQTVRIAKVSSTGEVTYSGDLTNNKNHKKYSPSLASQETSKYASWSETVGGIGYSIMLGEFELPPSLNISIGSPNLAGIKESGKSSYIVHGVTETSSEEEVGTVVFLNLTVKGNFQRYNYSVNWGDGDIDKITLTENTTATFRKTYKVRQVTNYEATIKVDNGKEAYVTENYTFTVYPPGDGNGDSKANILDGAKIGRAWGKEVGQEGYDALADLDADGGVGLGDVALFASLPYWD